MQLSRMEQDHCSSTQPHYRRLGKKVKQSALVFIVPYLGIFIDNSDITWLRQATIFILWICDGNCLD